MSWLCLTLLPLTGPHPALFLLTVSPAQLGVSGTVLGPLETAQGWERDWPQLQRVVQCPH